MRFVSSISLALVLSFALAACQSEDIPLTQDYRTQKSDDAAKLEYFETAALTYYEGRRYVESIRQWNKVLAIEPGRKKAKWGNARSFMGKGDIQSLRYAEAYLKEIVNLDWTHAKLGDRGFEVKRDLANVYGSIADHYDRDMRQVAHQLATDPNANGRLLEDQLAIQKGKRDTYLRRSLPLYRQVLKTSQDNPYALAGLAKTNLKLQNEGLGLMWAQRYLTLSRESQRKWKERMTWWQTEVGRGNYTPDQHKLFTSRIQGARQKEKKLRLLVASVHYRRGEYDDAALQYTHVIRMDPSIPAAYIERAQSYAALRQYGRAVQDVEEYLKITDPRDHREQRISAAELLERYQRVASRGGSVTRPTGAPTTAPRAGALPPIDGGGPLAPPVAPRRNTGVGVGSPDG